MRINGTSRNLVWQLCLLLTISLLFGGGGSSAGVGNLVVQLAALSVLALNYSALGEFLRTAPRMLVILFGVSLLLPLAQSVPLPPAIWQVLPGRDMVAQTFEMLGEEGRWFPISLDVHRTLLAFLSLLPTAAALILAWSILGSAPPTGPRTILIALSGLAVFCVFLGSIQLASGNMQFVFLQEAVGSEDLIATFASHNATAIFFNVGLCALVAALPLSHRSRTWILAGLPVALLLLVGIVLTRSRSGMALTLVPLGLAGVRVIRLGLDRGISRKGLLSGAALVALCFAGAGIVISMSQNVGSSFARFEQLDDPRPWIWEDTLASIQRYWPLGSGVGSFDEVIQLDESLEHLTPGRAARAHNDYLEVALESGVAGLALLASWIIYLAFCGWRRRQHGPYPQFSISVLLIIALQSISDYPLRNETLLCICGVALAFLLHPRDALKDGKPRN